MARRHNAYADLMPSAQTTTKKIKPTNSIAEVVKRHPDRFNVGEKLQPDSGVKH